MKRFLKGPMNGLRAKAAIRRKRTLRKAAAEMRLRENQEASIWKSGKGGYHYDH